MKQVPQPIWVVNRYLWSELQKADSTLTNQYSSFPNGPIFPINDANAGHSQWGDKPYLIYTQAFRVWHGHYVTKKATYIYSLKAKPDEIFNWGTTIERILNRQDDAAKDINEFNSNQPLNKQIPVYFHNVRVYQNEPPKPSDSSSSPTVTTQFQVVVEYHDLFETDTPWRA